MFIVMVNKGFQKKNLPVKGGLSSEVSSGVEPLYTVLQTVA